MDPTSHGFWEEEYLKKKITSRQVGVKSFQSKNVLTLFDFLEHQGFKNPKAQYLCWFWALALNLVKGFTTLKMLGNLGRLPYYKKHKRLEHRCQVSKPNKTSNWIIILSKKNA